MNDEVMPAAQAKVFDEVKALLLRNGFPGGFILLMQEGEDDNGGGSHTGLMTCLGPEETIEVLRGCADQLSEDIGVGVQRQ